jgi:hypothetical protein
MKNGVLSNFNQPGWTNLPQMRLEGQFTRWRSRLMLFEPLVRYSKDDTDNWHCDCCNHESDAIDHEQIATDEQAPDQRL